MSAYINELKRIAETVSAPAKPLALERRIDIWWRNLPPDERRRRRHIREFEALFNAPACSIGPVIAALGWKRVRLWAGDRPLGRFWLPRDEI